MEKPKVGRNGRLRRCIKLFVFGTLLLLGPHERQSESVLQAAGSPCGATINPIVCENTQIGNPPAEWDVDGVGDPTIEGFATDISVDQGQTVFFKINTDATAYRLDIYRMGYYGGQGARKVATVLPTASLPQNQLACLSDPTTGLVDCGNWAVSASWTVPATATSGIYFAKAIRQGSLDGSHIFFVVRDDDGQSDLLFQTADTTWQAYNSYGGNSLYTGNPVGRAYKVSYNRPFINRGQAGGPLESFVFNAEYPMVRWIEANGFDVSYFTGIDSDRRGTEILEHHAFLSVGHDEYWSAAQRANVEAARNAGVNLAFFSGNEVFWKTRWENSIDGAGTPYRTLVSYKETHAGAKIDPSPQWTGTWRDPRFSPPADGGQPENALTGTIFTVNGPRNDAIMVPAAFGTHRFWRNTSIATLQPGQTAILPQGTLGYEWDEDLDNGFRPAGLVRLSETTTDVTPAYIQDYGSSYGTGTATHSLTLYRASSGALVFGAGTVQWSWGLDSTHDRSQFGDPVPSVEMRQATVNLFADMGAQPQNLQPGLVLASPSLDVVPPASQITGPPAGSTLPSGEPVTITGTATDLTTGGGTIRVVEVSVDGGSTWHRAQGLENWTFSWVPNVEGVFVLRSRAVDDSGNLESPGPGISVTIARLCPCSLWNDSTLPAVAVNDDPAGVELGLRFQAVTDGSITGVRFYKGGLQNGGQHIGNLWSSTGQLLASVIFTGETPSGWQRANFTSPVPITANTTYVVSYFAPAGNYSVTRPFFGTEFANLPLRALQDGFDGANGAYMYGGGFPTNASLGTNYWVDVVFTTTAAADTTPPVVTSSSPSNGATGVGPFENVTARFSEPIDPTTINSETFELRDAANGVVPAAISYNATTRTATLDPNARLSDATTYRATLRGTATGVRDLAGNALVADLTWSFTSALPVVCPCTLWTPETVPSFLINNFQDNLAVELGLKFRADVEGSIAGIRFYKSLANVGPHTGTLWDINGNALATAIFAAETDQGWQEVRFAQPVPIVANQTYVASYHTDVGRYSVNRTYFVNEYPRAPLRAVADAINNPNGVYRYGPSSFPTESFLASNYWVDVVFLTTPVTNQPPTAVNDSAATDEDAALDLDVVANDTDADTLNAALRVAAGSVANVRGGTAALLGDGRTVHFVPAPNLNDSTTPGGFGFTYRITDGELTSATDAIVTITVRALNDAPVAAPQSLSTQEDTPKAMTLSGSDIESSPLTFMVVNQPSHGTLSGTMPDPTYTPAANYSGPDSFTFKANDGTADSTPATVSITVQSVNDLPTISNIVDQTTGEGFAVGPLSVTVGDLETPAASLTLTGSSTNPTLVPVANIVFGGSGATRTVTVTPVAGLTGTANITITLTDGNSGTANRTFKLTVTPRTATASSTPTSSLTPSTYGQAVTFTTTVTGAGGPPTGTVTFYERLSGDPAPGAPLGTVALSAGTASLTTSAVPAGTRLITATYNGNPQFAPSTSPALTQTVNKATTTTTYTFTPISQPYSDDVTFKATVSPPSLGGRAPATRARFKVGTQVMGEADLVLNSTTGALEATLTQALVETTPPGQLRPGSKLTTVEFVNVDPSVTVTNRTGSLSIRTEDARTAYSGPTNVPTGCSTCSTATVRLEATVWELNDGKLGDIRNATIIFINRGTGASIGTATLDTTKSTATTAYYYYNWPVTISGSSQMFTVGAVAGNYYTRNSTTENGTFTVYKPAP